MSGGGTWRAPLGSQWAVVSRQAATRQAAMGHAPWAVRIAKAHGSASGTKEADPFFRLALGSGNPDPGAMPQTASLLALVGVAGFALISLLFGIFT